MIWRTTPMQQRSKSGFIRDWLSATAAPPETFGAMSSKCEAYPIVGVGAPTTRRMTGESFIENVR